MYVDAWDQDGIYQRTFPYIAAHIQRSQQYPKLTGSHIQTMVIANQRCVRELGVLLFFVLFSSQRAWAIATRGCTSRRSAILKSTLTTAAVLGGSSCSAAVPPCTKSNGPSNCVATASVKQVDLYAPPWTWNDATASVDEVMARLKGAIAADPSIQVLEQGDTTLLARADRKIAVDELQFRLDPSDHVITFRSQQVTGPDSVSDFGANRKRLEEIRKRIGIVDIMGAEMASADSGPREGVSAQLKAFWGFQSGGGYESVLLDEDD